MLIFSGGMYWISLFTAYVAKMLYHAFFPHIWGDAFVLQKDFMETLIIAKAAPIGTFFDTVSLCQKLLRLVDAHILQVTLVE